MLRQGGGVLGGVLGPWEYRWVGRWTWGGEGCWVVADGGLDFLQVCEVDGGRVFGVAERSGGLIVCCWGLASGARWLGVLLAGEKKCASPLSMAVCMRLERWVETMEWEEVVGWGRRRWRWRCQVETHLLAAGGWV